LTAWRETAFFTDRERAALEWTESVTPPAHVPDATTERVRKLFTESELLNLTMAIVAISGWNRIAISFRMVPGTYQPKKS
jgi:alkylhydroperoxidase family enzyme